MKYFCAAPWKVLHISPQGEVHSCYESAEVLGNLYESSLQDIWGGEKFQFLREQMLSGEKPSACSKCHKKEEALEGKSLRTQLNHELGMEGATNLIPPLAPTYLDIAVSNTCNLKCRICGPYYSSSWMKELGDQTKLKFRAITKEHIEEDIFPLMTENLKKLVLTGGEPLIDRQNDELLRELQAKNLKDVALEYNTNATTIKEETLSLWGDFPNVRCNFSLDDFGAQFEYLRKGASWTDAVATMRKIKHSTPHVALTSYTTINIFNVLDYPYLVKEIYSLGLFEMKDIHLHYLVTPEYYSIQVLPLEIKNKVTTLYYEFMKTYLLLENDYKDVENMILQMKMILNYMNAVDLSHLYHEFLIVTEELDKKRGENFRPLFPHLA